MCIRDGYICCTGSGRRDHVRRCMCVHVDNISERDIMCGTEYVHVVLVDEGEVMYGGVFVYIYNCYTCERSCPCLFVYL